MITDCINKHIDKKENARIGLSSVDMMLIRPSNFKFKECHLYESLGIGYIAAYLRDAGYVVEILDGNIDEYSSEDIVERIVECNPLVVGFTILNDEYINALSIIKKIRNFDFMGHVTIGHHFATFNARRILKENPEIDSIVRFEGEKSAKALLEALKLGKNLDSVPNIVFRNKMDGNFIEGQLIELIPDLDELPFPARDVLLRNRHKFHYICMSGSRGCPWYCKFCSISAFYRTPNGKIWRARSPHNIIKEIENLIKQTGIRKFNFIDDQFMGSGEIGRTRALELANEIISRGLNIKFMIQTRSDSVQEDIFSNLAKAGLFRVFLGVESGYQPTLDYFCKQCRIESNVKAIDILKRLGIKISMGFIMFHEYSTLEEIEANLDFLETIINIGYTDYNIETFFNDLQIQPGTALFEEKSQWCFDSNYNGIYEIKDELARAYRKNLQGTLRPLTRPYEEIQIFRDRELFKEDILEIFERNMSLLAFNMAKNYLSYFKKRGEVPADVLCQKEKDIYRESVKLSATLSAIRNLNVDTDTVANAISNKLPS